MSTISNRRRGDIQLWSRTLIPTTREAPADAQTASHRLLVRAGYIRALGAGIYDYLPLAWRVIRKVSDIVRDEMNAAGGTELLLPALIPIELYKDTKRDVDYGPLLFKVEDRKGGVAALGPTHEEPITELMASAVTSYRQLPLILYQIQTKFRDEARPRAGLLRGREFLMKDAYSFHMNVEGPGGLNEAYDAMYRAYSNVFTRCGLSFTAVEAESGPIGGSASHEFMVNAESGEDTILRCPASGYAANVEKCGTGDRPRGTLTEAPSGELTEVHTPNLPGIEEVGKFMKVKPERMLKTLVFENLSDGGGGVPATPRWIIAVVRGDHEVNEGKIKAMSGATRVALADPKAAQAAGFAVGYVSPRVVNPVPNSMLLIDADASLGGFWASGADKPDHHIKHFNWRREVGGVLEGAARVKVGDLRNALVGDPSPRAPGGKLEAQRGIEVGHVFKLGTKYSSAMGFKIPDATQQRHDVIMGCYGIGVSRTMAACVEQRHDEAGIIWPAPLAPYHVQIVLMRPEDAAHMDAANRLAGLLADAGVDVLIDDRPERPGVKFNDADLVGLPVRLTIGDKAMQAGGVELKRRSDPGKGDVVAMEKVVDWCLAALNA